MIEQDDRSEDLGEPDPEDFLPAPPKKKGFLQQIPTLASLNPALLFFLLFLILSFLFWNYDIQDELWASRYSIFVKKEYWRALTAIFIHADMKHLLDNSLLFLIFGTLLYYFYGSFVFPFCSLIVGIVTTLLSAYYHEPYIRMLGASGMVYGMVAMWIVFYVTYEIRYSFYLRVLRAVGFALVILFPTSFHEEVDYMAHAIGFGIGTLAGILLVPFLNTRVERFYKEHEKISRRQSSFFDKTE